MLGSNSWSGSDDGDGDGDGDGEHECSPRERTTVRRANGGAETADSIWLNRWMPCSGFADERWGTAPSTYVDDAKLGCDD
jgi:hypothetical protein